jgi:ribosomal protein S1
VKGRIINRREFGVFVELKPGVVGLAHRSKLPENFLADDSYLPGEELEVTILRLDHKRERLELAASMSPDPSE